MDTHMPEPTGVTPIITDSRLLRDEVIKVAGAPFKRLLVYKLALRVPLAGNATVGLFSIAKGFTFSSISTSVSQPFERDAMYLLQDLSDGENIGVAVVRGGKKGLLPVDVPSLPAGLTGPCKVAIRYLSGTQPVSGELIIQIAISGPPHIEGDVIVDLDQDGVPDELGEQVMPLPGFILTETYDDFYAGFNAGLAGTTITS